MGSPTRHDSPRISPSGRLLVHRIRGTSGSGLLLSTPWGAPIHPLILGPGDFGPFSFLPDSSAGFFAHREAPEASWCIRSVPLHGRAYEEGMRLSGPGIDLKDPAAHPDGIRLAYASNEESPERFRIWELTPARKEKRCLTDSPGRSDTEPCFSPSGRFLAFTGTTATGTEIYLWDLSSGEVRQLTAGQGESHQATFLSESFLVFTRTLPTGDQGLLLLDLAKGREKWLTGVLDRPHHPTPWRISEDKLGLIYAVSEAVPPRQKSSSRVWVTDLMRARIRGAKLSPERSRAKPPKTADSKKESKKGSK